MDAQLRGGVMDIYWNDLKADLPTGLSPMQMGNPDMLMLRAFGITMQPADKRNRRTVVCFRANDGSKAELMHLDFQEFFISRAAEPVRVGGEMQQQQTQLGRRGLPGLRHAVRGVAERAVQAARPAV
ncbi:hypothetical protein JOS77_30615 [Chromobacterium haemolyticum]|nr:hypothetical protein JOS77_30615 [Chromobacterium haemolyticum]